MTSKMNDITIKIDGDTKGIETALQKVDKKIKNTQLQILNMEKLLKLDPSNIKLLVQYQQLLNREIEKTTNSIANLRDAEEKWDSSLKSKSAMQEQEGVSETFITAKNNMEQLAASAEKSEVELNKLTGFSDKIGAAAQKMQPFSTAAGIITKAVFKTVESTEELRMGFANLDTIAAEHAVNTDKVRDAWRKFAAQSGDTDSAIEATANLLQAGFTESNLQKAVENLAGAAIRFPGAMKIESLTDSLQETLASGNATGQFAELLDQLGIGAEQFNQKLSATNNFRTKAATCASDSCECGSYGNIQCLGKE